MRETVDVLRELSTQITNLQQDVDRYADQLHDLVTELLWPDRIGPADLDRFEAIAARVTAHLPSDQTSRSPVRDGSDGT